MEYYFVFALATLLGAGIGSFLGMAAYRIPHGMSFVKPARSFCPGCDRKIPWYRNLPVISWLLQRGRCWCRQRRKISPHYLLLELCCAALFGLNVCVSRGERVQAVSLSILVAYGLLASAIDLEHAMIPDSLSVQVAIFGFAASCAGGNPAFSGADLTTRALLSLGGLLSGAGLVGVLLIAGKFFFRPRPQRFDPPIEVEILGRTLRSRQGSGAWEEAPLTNYLLTRWERMELHAASGVETVTLQSATPAYRYRGHEVRQIVLPRDAIGLGDLKWLAALGAWVGPFGAVETIGLASVLACFGIVALIVKNRQKPSGIPFGPWLTAAAYVLLIMTPH